MSEFRDLHLAALVNRSILRHEATRENTDYISHSVNNDGKVTLTANVRVGDVRRFPYMPNIDAKRRVSTRTRTYQKPNDFDLNAALSVAGPIPLWADPVDHPDLAKWIVIEFIRQLSFASAGALPEITFEANSTVIIDTRNCPVLNHAEPVSAPYVVGANKLGSAYGLTRGSLGWQLRRYSSVGGSDLPMPRKECVVNALYLKGDIFSVTPSLETAAPYRDQQLELYVRPVGSHLKSKKPHLAMASLNRNGYGFSNVDGVGADKTPISVGFDGSEFSLGVEYDAVSGLSCFVVRDGEIELHRSAFGADQHTFEIEVIYSHNDGGYSPLVPYPEPTLVHTRTLEPSTYPVLAQTPEVPSAAREVLNNWIPHFLTDQGALTVQSVRGDANNSMVTLIDNKLTASAQDDRIKVRQCARLNMEDLSGLWAIAYESATSPTLADAVEWFSFHLGIGIDADDFEYTFEGDTTYLTATSTNAFMVGRTIISSENQGNEH